jgi:molybdopterin-guanine dinucleotide biosynthesis protein A
LQNYLNRGERKLQFWFEKHALVKVDFSNTPEIFANINTPEQLQILEKPSINAVKK